MTPVAHGWPPPLPIARDVDAEARGWRDAASDLASFLDTHLINRRDVWGAYIAPERREADKQHTYTAPGLKWRGVAVLERWRLDRHFRAESQGHVIGLHSTGPDDTSRWGGFDFDAHDNPPPDYLEALKDAAVAIVERLAEYGAAPLLEDSNGRGGFHVWVRLEEPAPTADVFQWLDHLADRARLDHGVAIETYPKQPSARGAFGNWLRLPGRHHTKPHWSRVARPGEGWRVGTDAARALLAWPATPASVVPPANAWPLRSAGVASDASTSTELPAERSPIISAYLEKLKHGNAGSGRSNRLFNLARFLRHGMQCTDAEALPILHAWNVGNSPPLAEAKVLETWSNAGTYASEPYQLREGVRRVA